MKPASILVTDNESNIRLTLRMALESEGYAVCEADDGRQALEAIALRSPDLMVLDLNMPALDGMAVLEQMQRLTGARPRVIVLTAYGSIPAAVKAVRLGADDFLEKPVVPSELRRAVRQSLDRAGRGGVSRGRADPSEEARQALRLAEYAEARTKLGRLCARNARGEADYFNLMGVLYESEHHWRWARRHYAKSLRADREFKPAQSNLRRLHELRVHGSTERTLQFGDDRDDLWTFHLPRDPTRPD